MDEAAVREKLLGILHSAYEVDPGVVSDESSLEDLGLDSLAQVELAAEFSKENIGARIADDEITGAMTFRGLVELVRARTP